jgi:E3 ubiquitin-protein ligase BRE1
MNACVAHALKSTEEDRHLAVNLESSKLELSNADKELKCLKSLLSSSEKEQDHIRLKMEEIQEELDNERYYHSFKSRTSRKGNLVICSTYESEFC